MTTLGPQGAPSIAAAPAFVFEPEPYSGGLATMTPPLFPRAGVRYEVAVDILGAIIAHWSAVIATERDKPAPNADDITLAEQVKAELRALRDELDPADEDGIERVIAQYGPQARDLYRQ